MSELEKRRTMVELAKSAGGGGYISAAREQELVEKGVLGLGLAPFEAQGLIGASADAHGIALETRLEGVLDKLVAAAADKRKRLHRDRFKELVAYLRSLSNGALGDAAAAEKVKRAAERSSIQPRAAGLLRSTRWYRRSGERAAKTREA